MSPLGPSRDASNDLWSSPSTLNSVPEPGDTDRVERPIRVLVLEDDGAVRAVHRAALEPVAEVVEAAGVYEALALIREQAVDVIVADVILPGARGTRLLVDLPRRGRRIPVVFVTILEGREWTADVLRRGAAAVLTKPVRPAALVDAVLTAAERR